MTLNVLADFFSFVCFVYPIVFEGQHTQKQLLLAKISLLEIVVLYVK